jgi:uncharacterized DUF497 family protein
MFWDENKRKLVLKEHHIDFAKITDIFEDAYGIYREDTEHSEDETRYSVVAITAEYGLTFAVFVYTKDEEIRFITARRAENWMVKEYEQQF